MRRKASLWSKPGKEVALAETGALVSTAELDTLLGEMADRT